MSFRCILVGEGNLTFIFCKLLAKSQLNLVLVITSNNKIIQWCHENKISFICSQSDYTEQLYKIDFEYLICAINENKLSEKIISRATICSVNYHDSILPNYAGVHATAWSILNGETHHGITWHVMNNKIDSGDIVLSKQFNLSQQETSLSLNIKCFDAAIQSFPNLIEILLAPPLKLTQQQKNTKSFFYKADKPKSNGLLTTEMTLHDIYRLLNASQFGHIDNDFYSVKIQISSSYYYILRAKCIFSDHAEPSGKIVEIAEDFITVTARGGYLQIMILAEVGHIISIGDVVSKHVLKKKQKILTEFNSTTKSYSELVRKNHFHEKKFIEKYRNLSIPLASFDDVTDNYKTTSSCYSIIHSKKITVSKAEFLEHFCELITKFMLRPDFILPIQHSEYSDIKDYKGLFLKYGFIYYNNANLSSSKTVNVSLEKQLGNLPFIQADIKWRYRGLDNDIYCLPLALSFEKKIFGNSKFILQLHQNKLSVFHNASLATVTPRLKEQLSLFVANMI